MNLLNSKWISVLVDDGSTVFTDVSNVKNPHFVSINFPREDLNGSVTMFLISYYQTHFCPENEKEWRKNLSSKIKTRPSLTVCPRPFEFKDFMQSNITGKEKKIQHLFFNSPSMDAVEKNLLYFDKTGEIQKICPNCATAAILFYQSNANMGGLNYFVSLRGSAPMNSLITGRTLWETIWYNVVPKDKLPKIGSFKGTLFPWMAKTSVFTSGNSHIFHSLWSMPRKIHLNISKGESTCDICNAKGSVIESFIELTPGIKYTAPKEDDGSKWDPWFINYSPLEYKGKKRGFETKKCWMPLTVEGLTEVLTSEHPYTNSLYNFLENRMDIPASLWIFGYITDQGKAVHGWLNQTVTIPENLPLAKNLIEQAQKWYKKAYYRLSMAGVNKSFFFNQLKEQFYKVTSGVELAEKWEEYVKSTIEKDIQRIIPDWTFEDQNPLKRKEKINRLPEKFTRDERVVLLSWHGKLMKKPEVLRQIKQTSSLEDVVHLRDTAVLSERLNGIMNTNTTAKVAKILAHVRHSNNNWLNINELTEERRERLRSGTWNDLLDMVDGTSVNVINLAEIIRNWDTFKQAIK